ncbi:biotin--protein ligase-like [Argonauta hians]
MKLLSRVAAGVMMRHATARNKSAVYVYSGEGCSELSLSMLLHSLKCCLDSAAHSVCTISAENIRQGSWMEDSAAICFGGGYDLGFIRSLGQSGVEVIHNYVRNGGSYLGICAGSYFACDSIAFDRGGPLQVCGERHLKFFHGSCEGPCYPGFKYNSEAGAKPALVNFIGTGSTFPVYYNGGGACYQHEGAKVNPEGQAVGNHVVDPNGHHVVDPKGNHGVDPKRDHVVNPKGHHVGDPNGHHVLDPKGNHGVDSKGNHGVDPKGDHVVNPKRDHVREPKDDHPKSEILARYEDIPGKPIAVVKNQVGLGTAVLTNVHLEFDSHKLDGSDQYLRQFIQELRDHDKKRETQFKSILQHLNLTINS